MYLCAECLCISCGAPASSLCSLCHSTYYCDKACQKRDWKSHKDRCKLGSMLWTSYRQVIRPDSSGNPGPYLAECIDKIMIDLQSRPTLAQPAIQPHVAIVCIAVLITLCERMKHTESAARLKERSANVLSHADDTTLITVDSLRWDKD